MNAGEEFVEHVGERFVRCACIEVGSLKFNLEVGHNYAQFLALIGDLKSVNYDAGYGGQELFGTIWYTDETWSTRWEYDGSEGWNYNKCPEIPLQLASKANEQFEPSGFEVSVCGFRVEGYARDELIIISGEPK